MSNEEIIIGDKMIEEQLIENSNKFNISLDELIDRYIRLGLFMDDFYEPPRITAEEFIESSKKEVEKDKKRGIPPKMHNFSVLIGRWSKSE